MAQTKELIRNGNKQELVSLDLRRYWSHYLDISGAIHSCFISDTSLKSTAEKHAFDNFESTKKEEKKVDACGGLSARYDSK